MNFRQVFAVAATLVCACSAGAVVPGEANDSSMRIAIIADSDSAASRNLADLLQAELAGRGDVELVERAEIDRVLAEQEISASGMVSGETRVRVGEILKARGLLFINDAHPTNGVLRMRLVETARGYVAGFALHSAGGNLNDTASAVYRMLPGLDVPPDGKVGVSVLVFDNALPYPLSAEPAVLELMDGMLDRLAEEMAAIPGTIILERRNLGDVAMETELAGGDALFLSGALLVDGGLSLKTQSGDLNGIREVKLTLRIRDLSNGASAVVSDSGNVRNLHAMAETAIEKFAMKAQLMRDAAGGGQAADESKVLDAIAKGYKADWAGEAALLIDENNKERVKSHMNSLLRGLGKSKDVRQAVLTIAKIDNLGRKHGMSAIDSLQCYVHTDALNWMMEPETFSDREMSRVLRPLRARLLAELEAAPVTAGIVFDRRMSWLRGIIRRPSERRKYMLELVDGLCSDPGVKTSKKSFLSSYLMHACRWKRLDLEEFRKSADPVRRHYANYSLLVQEDDREKQLEYSDAMLAGLDGFLGSISEMDISWSSLYFDKSFENQWIVNSLSGLCAYRPEKTGEVQRRLFERMKELVAANDIATLSFLNCRKTLATIPDGEVFGLLDDILSRKVDSRLDGLERFLADVRNWRDSLIAEHPEFGGGGGYAIRELISHASCGGRLVRLAGAGSPGNRKVKVFPQALLLEGDVLWIGVGGSPYRAEMNGKRLWRHPFGLMQLDLKSGKVVSERVDWFVKTGVQQSYTTINTLDGIVRVGDYIATLMQSLGVAALPARGDGKGEGKTLSTAEGLPGDERQYAGEMDYIGRIAGAGDKLFIGLGQWLVEWDFSTWESQIVLDVGAPDVEVGRGNTKKSVGDVKADPETGEVCINLNEVSKRFSHGWASAASYYRRDAGTGKWVEISDGEWNVLPDAGAVPKWVSEMLVDAKLGDVVASVPWNGGLVVLQGRSFDKWRLITLEPKAQGGGNGR